LSYFPLAGMLSAVIAQFLTPVYFDFMAARRASSTLSCQGKEEALSPLRRSPRRAPRPPCRPARRWRYCPGPARRRGPSCPPGLAAPPSSPSPCCPPPPAPPSAGPTWSSTPPPPPA